MAEQLSCAALPHWQGVERFRHYLGVRSDVDRGVFELYWSGNLSLHSGLSRSSYREW